MPALITSGPLPGQVPVLHSRPRLGLALFTKPGVRLVLAIGQPLGLGAMTPFPGPCYGRQMLSAWRSCSDDSAQGKEDWPDLLEEPALPSVTSCPALPAPASVGQPAGADGVVVWGGQVKPLKGCLFRAQVSYPYCGGTHSLNLQFSPRQQWSKGVPQPTFPQILP